MNRLLLKSATLAVAAFFSVAIAWPQTTNVMRFDVPFAFSVCEHRFPAGAYTVRWDPVANLIVLEKPGVDAIFLPAGFSETVAPQSSGMLHFHQYGTHYYLRGIQRDGSMRRDWPASRAEKETAGSLAPARVAVLRAR